MARRRATPELVPYHWRKGQSGNPKGRPKGQIDKVHQLQLHAAATGATPLQILLAIARKDGVALAELAIPPRDVTTQMRKSAAEAALPYVHRRMPIAIDGGGDDLAIRLAIERRVVTFSDQELDLVGRALLREGIPADKGTTSE